MEWECFWVNLREDNKVSQSKMAVSQSNMAEIQAGCHHQFGWEWISLSQIKLVWVRVLHQMAESTMAKFKRVEFKMAAIIKLNENERLKFFFLAKWMNPTWQNLSWLPLSSWVRENEWSFFCANGENQSWQVWVTLKRNTKMAESKMAKSRGWNWRWLPSSS